MPTLSDLLLPPSRSRRPHLPAFEPGDPKKRKIPRHKAPSYRHGTPSGELWRPLIRKDAIDAQSRAVAFCRYRRHGMTLLNFKRSTAANAWLQVDQERIEDPDSHVPMSGAPCDHKSAKTQEFCWCKYPQALFPNWTRKQQRKSRIRKVIKESRGPCRVFYADVKNDGIFVSSGAKVVDDTDSRQTAQWRLMMEEVRPYWILDSPLKVIHWTN
jgi:hypothetical protein